jgi:hypothetical protein
MMIDPAKMSGIPRPDGQVPAGTVTVRLIRGELSNRMAGFEVQLVDPKGGVKATKTDVEGRATFEGLAGGPFVARASDGTGQEITSQPIELPSDAGVRVMLVFSAGGPGTPDGVARVTSEVAVGTVLVRVQDGEGKPLPFEEVVLGQMRVGENGVRESHSKTDAKGEIHFSGLDAKPTSGYLVEVVKQDTRIASKPFRLTEKHGSLVVLAVRPAAHDLSALRMAQGSHFILQVGDDAVQVIEVWRLHNEGAVAFDPGPGGLHLPLPDKAVSAVVGPDTSPNLAVSGHEAVWSGLVPPGDTQLQVMFVLPYENGIADLQQRTSISFEEVALVTEKIDGMSIEGNGDGNSFAIEERELQGRKLILARGPGTSRGGQIRARLSGLPHADSSARKLAASLALALLVGFGFFAAQGREASQTRSDLEKRVEALLDELASMPEPLSEKPVDPRISNHERSGQEERRRQRLTAELADQYRRLDELP